MESPSRALILSPLPPPPPPDLGTSPEFEFWNSTRNNTEPIHSADELFSHGFLLPMYSLPNSRSEPGCDHEPGSDKLEKLEPGSAEPGALITSVVSSSGNSVLSASKRWREIFRRSEKKEANDDVRGLSNENKCEKIGKKTRRNQTGSGSGSAELNINLWPFSRSRSAGNAAARSNKPEKSSTSRKASSAPCSRSNSSGGESRLSASSSRRSWPGSPARPGVHLGRASPVWQVKRAGSGTRATPGGGGSSGVGVGYRQRARCGGDDNGAVVGGDSDGGAKLKSGGGSGNLFGFRGLFSKKSDAVLTV
ncbi:hypothetical protein vseg_011563 [Gypsophila vaccaria]